MHGKKMKKLNYRDQSTSRKPVLISHKTPLVKDKINIEEFTNDWNSGMRVIDMVKKYKLSYPEKAKRLAKNLDLVLQHQRIKLNFYERFVAEGKNVEDFTELYLNPSVRVREIKRHFGFADSSYSAQQKFLR